MKGPKKKWQYYILILILGPLYPPSPAPIPCAGSSRYPPFLSKGGGGSLPPPTLLAFSLLTFPPLPP